MPLVPCGRFGDFLLFFMQLRVDDFQIRSRWYSPKKRKKEKNSFCIFIFFSFFNTGYGEGVRKFAYNCLWVIFWTFYQQLHVLFRNFLRKSLNLVSALFSGFVYSCTVPETSLYVRNWLEYFNKNYYVNRSKLWFRIPLLNPLILVARSMLFVFIFFANPLKKFV